MAKSLFESKKEAVVVIERCINSIKLLEDPYRLSGDLTEPAVVGAIGRSLTQHVYTMCEALLYLVCRERRDCGDVVAPKEWPRLQGLSKYCDQCECGECPFVTSEIAEKMTSEKKKCDKRDKKAELTPNDIAQFFDEAREFAEWLEQDVNKTINNIDILGATDFLVNFLDSWFGLYRRESGRNSKDYRWSFRYQDINTDYMTDEEEDEFYRQRKGNKRESMAPLFIYLILQRFDKDNCAHVSDIQAILEEEYEIELSRGAVERALNTMVDGGDVNVWSGLKRGSGYWYSEEDENEEIED